MKLLAEALWCIQTVFLSRKQVATDETSRQTVDDQSSLHLHRESLSELQAAEAMNAEVLS